MPTQTTCVDSGNATLLKRGDAAPNAEFFAGAWTIFIQARVTDWVSNSSSSYLNIFEMNSDPGNTGTQGGLGQVYYEVTSDNIRLYVGEAWSVSDTSIRSGAHTGWGAYAFSCAGSTTDQVKFSYIFDDQSTVTTQNIGLGGSLRQVLAIGGIGGEEPFNTRHVTLIVYKRQLTDAEIKQQRASPTPIYTGSDLFFFQAMADATNPEADDSETYSGPGTNDFTAFTPGAASQQNDYPSAWDNPEISGTTGVLLSGASLFAGGEVYDSPSTGMGRAWLDFGYEGSTQASVVLTGQTGVVSTTKVECWLMAEPTAWHNTDEHRVLASMKEHKPIVSEVGTGTFKITMTSPWVLRGVWKCRFFWSNV